MRVKTHQRNVWALGALLLAIASVGSAQTLSSNPERAENGIRLGDARLHPFFDLELHYDSAAGYFGPSQTLGPEILAHFRPGARLELPSDSLALDLNAFVDYVYYTGLLTPGTSVASRLEAGANLALKINPKGAVSLELGDDLHRSDRSNNAAVGVGVLSFFNDLTAAIPIRPGGGALEIIPRGGVSVELFQALSEVPIPGCNDITCHPDDVRRMSYLNLRAGLDGRWRFLPKTAVVVEGNFDSRAYFDPGISNPPANLLRAEAGVQGLLTTKVAIIAKVGWAYDFGISAASTLIAHLEASYYASELANLRAGYLRTVEPVPGYGTYGDDRGYLEGRVFMLGRLALHAYAAVDLLTFYSAAGRVDTSTSLNLGPEYEITAWLRVAAGYDLTVRTSNGGSKSANYQRNEAYLRVSFTY